MVVKGEGIRGGIEWKVVISRCKLLYINWINKVLLHAHPGAAVMDRLGSGIPLDPTTGTRSAGATEFVLGGEGRGQSWGDAFAHPVHLAEL